MDGVKPQRVDIVGVRVDLVTAAQALDVARGFLEASEGKMITTPNPEMAVLAAKDPGFADVMASADLAICDGFGLKLAASLWGIYVPEVLHGSDFALVLARLCEQEGRRLYLLGGSGEAAERSAKFLRARFPELEIVGAESGGMIKLKNGAWDQDPYLLSRIADAAPHVLFVALGHGKQETWIRRHLAKLPSVRIAIGIGGSFDYWSGVAKRPPAFVRAVHLEWLWRLVMDPAGRAKRIFDATVVFPLLALKKRLFPIR